MARRAKSKARLKNRLGNVSFDATFSVEHSFSMTITSHPVESGCEITDHSYLNPVEISMQIGASDSGTSWTRGRRGHSVSVFNALKRLQATGVPFSVTTRLGAYKNMLIANMSVPDDYTTMHALKVNIMLREIRVVKTATVGVSGRSSDPQKTGATSSGPAQASSLSGNTTGNTNQSVLAGIVSQAQGLLGGKAS